ncbi:MAG TPA: N-6 DNA methylase [Caulobacteraceae bacterium]
MIRELARDYYAGVHAAASASVDAEEEAQLTTPVANLFRALASEAGLGVFQMVRETRLDRTRPDFAVLLTEHARTRQKGFIELKGPSTSVDVTTWSGRNARQWTSMAREAEILIVCNGVAAQIYKDGEPYDGPATLPYTEPEAWDPSGLIRLLRLFVELDPTPIVSVRNLSERLAHRTADLRDRLLWLLDQSSPAADAAKGGLRAWRQHVQPTGSPRDFADGVSQVIAYGMVLAALSAGGADADGDGFVTVMEAREALRQSNPVLAAAFAPLIDKPVLAGATQVELGALETLISAIDADRVNASADPRGEPWLYFYEDFLSEYDPDERRQAGVYYTPVAIVRAMARIADHVLVERFGRRLGFADGSVVTLDPAAGSGAFPLAVIDQGVERARQVRGAAGPRQAAANLARNLFAFELLPGPYSVAHLRLGTRLSKLLEPEPAVAAKVVLTDTLESPFQPPRRPLWLDGRIRAADGGRGMVRHAVDHGYFSLATARLQVRPHLADRPRVGSPDATLGAVCRGRT